MSLPSLGLLKLRRDGAGGVRVSAAPDRSPLVARAGTALAQLGRMAEGPGARAVDVQLVVQVSDDAGYDRWRAGREASWRKEGGRYTTAGWPRELGADTLAAVLLPLPYGRKGSRVVAGPLFSTRSRADGSGAEDVALGLIAEWLRQATTGSAPFRLAPPLLETGAERRVLDLGLAWPLAAAA
jgi:hypothetical protein